ncbi:MAG: gliding motility-associated C-terminal domain-containing protein [Bacteroidetes bacterium]|nr:gliding motility-associated C-terminal domain-containing protein [Bacteroidota bacterium]MBM3424587.1 T9SS type B sorting domain-containing protein [Bacteroidota bacterium]
MKFFTLFVVVLLAVYQGKSQTTVNFNYTGAVQTWIVPPCVYNITAVVAGAKGGGPSGGNGARITGNIAVTPGQTLYIYCGGMGTQGSNSGGWNGGGTGHASGGNFGYSSYGGGGASDIRINGQALANRVIVAGGGGGRGGGSWQVCGGTANCINGAQGCNTYGAGGGGGTQFSGGNGGAPWAGVPPGGQAGTLGQGGQGGPWSTASGGGGGGGYYGGGGGGNDGCCTGANGGGGGGAGSSLMPAGGSCLGNNNTNHGYAIITYSGGAAQVTATSNSPVCSGSTIQLNTSAQGTYSWTGPNGFTSSLQNPTIPNATAANAGTYTVTVNLGGGCIGTATTTVTVNPSPNVTVSSATICAGQPGTITASVNPPLPGTYVWNTGATGASLTASPNATTLYTVTFTATGGCPGTATGVITVNPTPVLTVNNPVICTGQSATMNASATIPGGTFTWNPGATTGPSLTVSPNVTTSYTLSYSTPAGCPAQNTTATVTVNPTPSVTVNSVTICNGQTTTLTATPTVVGGNYSWNTGSTNQSINVNPSVTTTYTVNYSSAAGCPSQSASGTVTVNPTPTITATSATICAGQSAILNASTNTQGGTFTWNPGGMVGSSINVSPQTTTTYTLDYISGAGCSANQATGTVTVNPVAVVSVNSATICDGNSATLTATATVPGGTFAWNTGATTPSITVSPNTTTSYTVVYTSGAGCISPIATGIVTVNPTPVLTITNDTICIGQTGSITATSSLPNGTFAWNPGGFTTATIQDNPQQTTTYTVIFTSNLQCPSAPVSGTILVNPNPAITVSNTAICLGQTATVTATSNIPGGVFTWNPGNLNGPTLTASPNVTTSWTVSYSAATGCAAQAQPVTVTVNGIPTLIIPNDTICVGQTGTLSASASIPGGTYLWSPGGQTTSSIAGSPAATTTYNLVYTSPAGCVSVSTPSTMVVNPLPVITVSNAAICNGQSATLNSTTSIPGGTYAWSNGSVTPNITVSPNTTTTYSLVYTAPTGCQNTAVIGTVTVNPVPTVSVLNDTICNGSSSTLTATPSFPGGTFLWSPGGQTTQNITVSPNSTTVYSVIYSSGANCASPAASASVLVNPIPSLNTTLASPTLCSGNPVNIGLSSNVGNATISWTNSQSQTTGATSGSGGTIGDVLNTISTATGNVSYTITSTANNCSSAPQTVSVTVYPIPNVSIANDTICAGQTSILTAVPDVNGGTFLWSAGAQTTASISVTPAQTSSYNVLYDYYGCVNTANATVVVNVVPSVTLNSGNICFGDTLILNALPSTPGGIYTWNPGGVGPQSIAVNPGNSTSISVDYTLNNCTSSIATSNIIVTQLPVLVMDDTTICQGQQATMTAVPSQAGGSFTWSPGGPGPQTAVFTPPSTTTISVTYTLNGCTSNAVSRNVFVNPLPVATVITPAISGCIPLSYAFFADTSLAHDAYTWSVGGITYSGDSISGTVMSGGCQSITLTNTLNGCATSTTYIDHLCPENPPIANFDASVEYFTEPSQSVNFFNTSVGASTYLWLFQDGGTSTATSPSYNFSGVSGSSTIMLYAYSPLGCVDSTSMTIPLQDGLIYYIPNTFTPDGDPSNHYFQPVFTSGFDPFNYSLQIYNRWGELIFESLNPNVGWDGSYGVYGNQVPSGTYTYRIRFKVLKNDEYQAVVGHVNLLK